MIREPEEKGNAKRLRESGTKNVGRVLTDYTKKKDAADQKNYLLLGLRGHIFDVL